MIDSPTFQQYFEKAYDKANVKPAGEQAFGIWLHNVESFENDDKPFYAQWCQLVRSNSQGNIRYLDAGSGNGAFCIPAIQSLSTDGHRVHAVLLDLQEKAAQEAKERTNVDLGEHTASVIRADSGFMPLQDNCVDAVFSRMALHWLPEVEQTLSEFQRVVKPNGLVLADVCTIYNKACLGHIGMPFEEWQEKTNNGTSSDMFPIYHANFKKWMNFFTLPGLQHQFESHGFRLVESVYPYKNTDFPNDEFTDGKESYFENAVILAQKRFSN